MARRTNALDVAYLAVWVATALTAAWAIIASAADSWFRREQNAAFALLFGALALAMGINLLNGLACGKLWARTGPVYRDRQPKLFRAQQLGSALMCSVASFAALWVWLWAPRL